MNLERIVNALQPKKRVFIVGSAFVDMILTVHALPHAGEDVEGHYRKTMVGGCSFNVADVLHALALPFDSYMPVGEGPMADRVVEALKARDYPVYRETGEGDNGWCLSIADHTGERTFISMFGLERRMKPEWFDRFDMASYDYIYLSGYQMEGDNGQAILQVLARKNPRAVVLFDPGPRVSELAPETVAAIEAMGCIYNVNREEALWMTKETTAKAACEALARRTKRAVVVTDGAKGAWICDGAEVHEEATLVPGFAIESVDTIGSGDAHTGGLLAALACELNLRDGVVLANACAAHVTRHEGAACAPDRETLVRLYGSH